MNVSSIIYFCSQILGIEGVLMALPCIVAVIYGERQGLAFLPVMAVCIIIGLIARARRPVKRDFFVRDAMITCAFSWLLMSAAGALPFTICGDIPSYVDALFETISGFTTTGASILTNVEAMSRCMLFWRSFTHWIGGMGILVFMLAVIPMTGGSQMNLMKAESPGPSVGKFVPRLRTTATLMYTIYLVLTAAEIIILIALRMRVFDAVCMSFGSAGTGGFGVLNDSAASYTAAQQVVIGVFMLLFGVNFTFYFYIISRKLRLALGMEEVRAYIAVVLGSVVLIAINIFHMYSTAAETLRASFFQVSSIITTTGFVSVDFDRWPLFSRMILVVLMFIGACAGSTGGGLKVSRVVVMFKSVRNELRHAVQPREVRRVYLDGKPMDTAVVQGIYQFFMAYTVVFAVSFLIVSLENTSFGTAFTAIAATINNIGPGLEMVGPTVNYSFFSPLSKFVMMFDMLAGRLEILPMLILVMPNTWKKMAGR